MNLSLSTENTPFIDFCKIVFSEENLEHTSLRLIAELDSLKLKLSKMNGSGAKLNILKMTASEAPFKARVEQAQALNVKGYGVFYLINEFRAGVYEESYGNISSLRGFVVDLDGAPLEPVKEWMIPPTAIVETSSGKFQCIWSFLEAIKVSSQAGGKRFSRDLISIDDYNELASRLSALFNGDQNVCKATQCFRAPGFKHWKQASGFDSRCISHGGKVSFEEILRAIRARKTSKSQDSASSPSASESNGNYEAVDLTALQLGEIEVSKGERHDTILRLATKLFHDGLNEAAVLDAVTDTVRKSFAESGDFLSGSRAQEIEKAIRDAKEYWHRNKEEEDRLVKDALAPSLPLTATTETGQEVNLKNSGFKYDFSSRTLAVNPYTESGITERILQRFEGDLIRINRGVWCFWQAKKAWVAQLGSTSMYEGLHERAVRCVIDMLTEPELIRKCLSKKGFDKKMYDAMCEKFFKEHVIEAVCRGVMNSPGLPVYKLADFDCVPWMFYCANGLLDLRTGELREAVREDRLFFQSRVEWKGLEEKCPGWLKFLSEVFEDNFDNRSMCAFMQELFGYSLSGLISEEKIFCHYGSGANGKSKMLGALGMLMGEYSCIIDPDELTARKNGFGKAFERTGAKVEAKRIAVIDDLEVGSVWNEGFVKTLTAKTIRARAEYERSREVPNRCKFHLGLNIAPEPEAENLGILRRLCIIPYERTFEATASKERELTAMIEREASGILAWAVRGYMRMCERGGLAYPEETKAASENYKREHFKADSAIDACFAAPEDEKDGTWETLGTLCEVINGYLDSEGLTGARMSPDSLGRALKSKFKLASEKKWLKSNMVRCYFIKIKFDLKKETLAKL